MKVQSVATEAAALAHKLTKHLAGRGTGDQLRRAAASVVLNTAEGLGYEGANERKFLRIAYASCQEATAAVQILAMSDQVDLESARDLYRKLHRSGGMLYGLLRK